MFRNFYRPRRLSIRKSLTPKRHGHPLPAKVRVGVMIEVPSLSYQLDALLPLVDFVSVGSNDLFQFFFAADRENDRVARRFDTLSPAAPTYIT